MSLQNESQKSKQLVDLLRMPWLLLFCTLFCTIYWEEYLMDRNFTWQNSTF